MIGTLNKNSFPSKFHQGKLLINATTDVMVLTETKLDNSSPSSQFHIEGYSMTYRLSRNRNGRGVQIYTKDGIVGKILNKHVLQVDIKILSIELNFLKNKMAPGWNVSSSISK